MFITIELFINFLSLSPDAKKILSLSTKIEAIPFTIMCFSSSTLAGGGHEYALNVVRVFA